MKSKLMTMLTAFALVFGILLSPFTNANAAAPTENGTKTVTVHKLLMSPSELSAWDAEGPKGYDGTQNLDQLKQLESVTTNVTEIPGVYFAWQRQVDGAWVYINSQGNPAITQDPQDPTFQNEVLGALTTENGSEFNTSSLPEDTYRINEIHALSTYIGADGETLTGSKAVPVEITLPLRNEKGDVANVHVYPKNTSDAPETYKDFTDQFTTSESNGREDPSLADPEGHFIGDSIGYTIKTVVPAQSNWATAFWDDAMTEGLTFNQGSVTITYNGELLIEDNDYILTQGENGFTLSLTETGFEKINGKAERGVILVSYSATLNKEAVADIPESNDVTFHYGNQPNQGNTPKPNKPNENGDLTITKTWAPGAAPYDATFTLYNAQTGQVVTTAAPVEGYTFENPAHINAGGTSYTWRGLDPNIQYKVVESYEKGYAAWYQDITEAGQIAIENRASNNPQPINPNEPKVETYGKKFVKTDQATGTRLEGAQFVIRNPQGLYLLPGTSDSRAYDSAQAAYNTAVNAYNAVEEPTQEQIEAVENARKARDNAWIDYVNNLTNWGEIEGDDWDQALILTSDANGQFEIRGLNNNYSPRGREAIIETYYLVEIAPPAGYVLPTNHLDGIPFEIGPGSYNSGDIGYEVNSPDGTLDADEVPNTKVTIPQTGGIGSLIFIVAGIAIMGIALVMRRRSQYEGQ